MTLELPRRMMCSSTVNVDWLKPFHQRADARPGPELGPGRTWADSEEARGVHDSEVELQQLQGGAGPGGFKLRTTSGRWSVIIF